MLRGSLSTHFLHDTGSLLIHSLLSRREDFEDPPTLKKGHQSLEDLKTKDRRSSRRVYNYRRSRQSLEIEDKATAKGEFVGALVSVLCLYSVCI
ncbi:hypothetical protein Hdeb2414_s0211g00833861 [Helianthus debilis subsp. tardiflorus]